MVEARRNALAPAWLESVLKFLIHAWTIYRGTAPEAPPVFLDTD